MTWNKENNKLVKDFTFKDFSEALAFMVRVGLAAEAMNHHPKIVNDYNKVRLELCTHDAGHIVTDKDRNLSRKIDDMLHTTG